MIGLLDCNNFYCSCERVFRPDLEHKPIAVLSNNDGCIISRSQEVKALGIPMAAPLHRHRPLIQQEGVHLVSANFPLYGDLSERVMNTLREFAPAVEVYSIDEAFFDLSSLKPGALVTFCHELRATIRQWTGIPVSIGVGPTKTLAKLANRIAKKRADCNGVYALTDPAGYHYELGQCDVIEVWGVGHRLAQRLRAGSIRTAWDLAQYPTDRARDESGIVLARTVRELRGICCLPLELGNPYRQRIMVSRSFGRDVRNLDELRAAITSFAVRAGEKLRRQNCKTQSVTVFAQTSPHKDPEQQYGNGESLPLENPTDNSRDLIDAAVRGLTRLYKRGDLYKKAGVMLDDIRPNDLIQPSLFAPAAGDSGISKTIDAINARMGADTLRYAAMDVGTNWRMNQQYRSRKYSTSWKELPVAR
jgi:DNA polymerase V